MSSNETKLEILKLNNDFPRTYNRQVFGVKLNPDLLQNRCELLGAWLNELLSKYELFGNQNIIDEYLNPLDNIQNEIAMLLGTTKSVLQYELEYANAKSVNPNDSDDEYDPVAAEVSATPQAGDGSDMPQLPKLQKRRSHETSKLMNLFDSVHVEKEASKLPETAPETVVDEDQSNMTGEDGLPLSSDELYSYNIIKLGDLCRLKGIDCTNFKSKKNYIKALLLTYNEGPSYLSDKNARLEISKLNDTSTLQNAFTGVMGNTMIHEIDTIFIDLLKRIGVHDSLYKPLRASYTIQEKLVLITQTVCVWDNDVYFTKEDIDMLTILQNETYVNSILLLTMKYRIYQSTYINLWLRRFCSSKGVTVLLGIIDTKLQTQPLTEYDAACLLCIIQSFRRIMESECRNVVVNTRGCIDAFVQCILFEFKPLALQALELLSEVIIYGGESAIWQIKQGFTNISLRDNTVPFAILVDALALNDIALQSSIVTLINSIVLYETNIQNRIKLRSILHSQDYEFICSVITRKFKTSKNNTSNNKVNDETEQDDNEEIVQYNKTYSLRAGVVINVANTDVDEQYAEDMVTLICPEMGTMASYGININNLMDVKFGEPQQQGATGVGPLNWLNRNSWYPGKNIEIIAKKASRRLSWSGNLSNDGMSEDEFYNRFKMWYHLQPDGVLSWTFKNTSSSNSANTDESLIGSIKITDVLEILDYCALTVNITYSIEYCITIVMKSRQQYFINLENSTLRNKWYIALISALHTSNIHKTAYRMIDETINNTTILKLQKNFEKHVNIYKDIEVDDNKVLYKANFSNIIESGTSELFELLLLEYKKHKNEFKIKTLLKDLTVFALENYSPQNENDEFAVKPKYPVAVKSSEREIPLPPQLPFIPPAKQTKKSTIKLKQLFWTKIKPIHVLNTVWMDMTEPEIDYKKLEYKYAEVSKSKVLLDKNKQNDNKKKIVSLFDGKRTQNAAIASGKLKKAPEEIAEIVLNLDPDELTLDVTETISNLLIPNEEEMNALRTYTGDRSELDFAGKLFSYFIDIERLDQRLNVQRIMLNWYDELFLINEQLNIIKDALTELNDPQCISDLRLVLSIILSLGNYLNGITSRGGAHGYKLEILLKLKNIKSNYGKGNLLHFVIEELTKIKSKEIGQLNSDSSSSSGAVNLDDFNYVHFYSNWKAMWRTTKVNMKNIDVAIKSLETGLTYCLKELEAAEQIQVDRVKLPLIERLSMLPCIFINT
jgi:hypothetical protein